MFKKVFALLGTALLTVSVGFAHVQNEYTIYDDVQYSEARKDIVTLRGLGVIPSQTGVNIFGPQDILTKEELGNWAGRFLFENNEEWKDADYVNQAVAFGMISDKKGNATFEDVVIAYFGKEELKSSDIKALIKDKEKKEITKEETASLLGSLLDRGENVSLFMKSGLQKGPVGVIDEIKVEKVGEGESSYEQYVIVIEGATYPLGHHPKVVGGPTEIEKWKGKEVIETWLVPVTQSGNGHDHADHEHQHEPEQETKPEEPSYTIDYLKVKDASFKEDTYAPVNKKAATDKKATEEKEENSFPWVLVISVLVAASLVFVVLKARKK